MEIIKEVIDFVLHIDVHLGEIIENYGRFSYAILFLIIFAETGLVFTPFLPGDSLLFAAGMFAATGSFDVVLLALLLWLAVFLGDNVNYWVGHFLGEKIIANPKLPINQKHIDKTQAFYDKHGGKTIFLARFVPIIRTFAPFVAGVGRMKYKKFISYSVAGSFVWITSFTLGGYFFGNIQIVKENFSIVVVAIILISISPFVVQLIKGMIAKLNKNKKNETEI